jgi:hypothetical protein
MGGCAIVGCMWRDGISSQNDALASVKQVGK